jgi:hypothetical protein
MVSCFFFFSPFNEQGMNSSTIGGDGGVALPTAPQGFDPTPTPDQI